jgi:hypothetical protein
MPAIFFFSVNSVPGFFPFVSGDLPSSQCLGSRNLFSELHLGFFFSANDGWSLVRVLNRGKSGNAFALTEINSQISRAKHAST